MKAIVLHQPWATLVAIGAKRIETRPYPPAGEMRPAGAKAQPGFGLEHAERIAILAGARRPEEGLRLGLDAPTTEQEYLVEDGRLLDLCNERTHELPLGAVVCTAQVLEALEMVDGTGMRAGDGTERVPDALYLFPGPPPRIWWLQDNEPCDVSAEMPFGDYSPGRFGWMLGGVQPTAPLPRRGERGVFKLDLGDPLDAYRPPADVAAALAENSRAGRFVEGSA